MGGQYYKVVIIGDTKDVIHVWLDPYDYGEGYHLMQHTYLNTLFLGAIEFLISPEGKYHKSRIIWAGDYGNLYPRLYNNTKLNPPVYDTRSYRYIVNHSQKKYVDKYPDGNSGKIQPAMFGSDYKIHPLPLLVVDNIDGSKGSYKGNNKNLLGTWSGDIISVEIEPPKDYIELECNFQLDI